ncbi:MULTISPECIES: hypothetical protein [Streptomyces]|uniref:Uncharacterized protein n=1 Tax=Streptomyces lichenis TaxID=2306967 RepID=A0ABT0IFA1_9ACTN|nr:hypothetical protein [Streptomyces lichenis]MCK8679990.1 hypothetical protein [Streptomyces lichenis]
MRNPHLAVNPPAGRFRDAEGTPYMINVAMSPETVQQLAQGNYKLFMFKAVQSAVGGGAPTVWAATTQYSTSTSVAWTEDYYAYASMEEIQNGVDFSSSDTEAIDLGQILQVSGQAVGSVVDGGTPGAVTVQNTVTTPFTCGLAQPNPTGGGLPTPICAFPLYGLNLDLIVPLEKVALVFAAAPYQEGMVIESSIGPAVLADLTLSNNISLGYDINNGWSWTGNQASDIPSDQFIETLIVPSGLGQSVGLPNLLGDAVTSVSIWTPMSTKPFQPNNIIARASSGSVDQNSLAAVLTPQAGAAVIRKDQVYIAEFFVRPTVMETWQVQCTYVPEAPGNPYDFKKLREIPNP